MSVLQSLVPSAPVEVLVRALLPDTANLRLEHVRIDSGQLLLTLLATHSEAACPLCDQPSRRIQSRYIRTLADLAWATSRVQLRLHVRRFFCPNPACIRKIFTERMPAVVLPYARHTNRLRDQLLETGFALGGEAGARQCAASGIGVSPDTLLALLRRHAPPAGATPRILGVDDWSFRRHQRMGTILVDLEQHRVVDLLPESTEEVFVTWLQTHPGVEMISRDRGEVYASGGRTGAPNAIHIADRWHVVKKLGDCVQKLLVRHSAALRQAARVSGVCTDQAALAVVPLFVPPPRRRRRIPKPPTESYQRRWQLSMDQQVRELAAQHWSVGAITRQLKITRITVRNYRDREQFCDQRTTARPSAVEPYRAYVEQRWAEGCTEVKQLWQELQAQGYQGSYKSVWMFTRGWQSSRQVAPQTAPATPTAPARTPRQAMWLLARAGEELDDEDSAYRDALCEVCPDIAQAYPLVQSFQTLVRTRQVEQLASWLEQVQASGVRELRRFA